MTQKKSYSRYFIILQEEEKGYSLASDKLPSGYTKLEIKNERCKISYYVQNLKKERQPYYMILICCKKGVDKIINLGELNIDEYGRTEIFYEYSSEDICGSNISVDKIAGAAIVKFEGKHIIPVMSGFSITEIPNWKELPIIVRNEEKSEEKNEFDKYESIIENMKENTNQNEEIKNNLQFPANKELRHEGEIPIPEEIPKEISPETLPEMPLETLPEMPPETPQIPKVMPQEAVPEKKEYKCDGCNKKADFFAAIGGFFMGVVEGFKEIEDIFVEIKRCKWYKVEVKSLDYLYDTSDYDKYTVAYYPMISYYPYIKNYGHYIMGYKCDINGKLKYIVYAIPGSRRKEDQPYGGKSGFVTWVPLKSDEDDIDSFGYWLMFYDYKNATIVVPIK